MVLGVLNAVLLQLKIGELAWVPPVAEVPSSIIIHIFEPTRTIPTAVPFVASATVPAPAASFSGFNAGTSSGVQLFFGFVSSWLFLLLVGLAFGAGALFCWQVQRLAAGLEATAPAIAQYPRPGYANGEVQTDAPPAPPTLPAVGDAAVQTDPPPIPPPKPAMVDAQHQTDPLPTPPPKPVMVSANTQTVNPHPVQFSIVNYPSIETEPIEPTPLLSLGAATSYAERSTQTEAEDSRVELPEFDEPSSAQDVDHREPHEIPLPPYTVSASDLLAAMNTINAGYDEFNQKIKDVSPNGRFKAPNFSRHVMPPFIDSLKQRVFSCLVDMPDEVVAFFDNMAFRICKERFFKAIVGKTSQSRIDNAKGEIVERDNRIRELKAELRGATITDKYELVGPIHWKGLPVGFTNENLMWTKPQHPLETGEVTEKAIYRHPMMKPIQAHEQHTEIDVQTKLDWAEMAEEDELKREGSAKEVDGQKDGDGAEKEGGLTRENEPKKNGKGKERAEWATTPEFVPQASTEVNNAAGGLMGSKHAPQQSGKGKGRAEWATAPDFTPKPKSPAEGLMGSRFAPGPSDDKVLAGPSNKPYTAPPDNAPKGPKTMLESKYAPEATDSTLDNNVPTGPRAMMHSKHAPESSHTAHTLPPSGAPKGPKAMTESKHAPEATKNTPDDSVPKGPRAMTASKHAPGPSNTDNVPKGPRAMMGSRFAPR